MIVNIYFFIEKHRRTKDEKIGRIHKCECGKAYFNKQALNNHIAIKHPPKLEELQRAKGRPRKYSPNKSKHSNTRKNKFDNFFNKYGRNPIVGQYIEIFSLVEEVYSFIYESPYAKNLFSKPKSYRDIPILYNLVSKTKIGNKPKNEITCDEAFLKYLNTFMNKTNRKYFSLMLKFVLLFRECYNLIKNKGKKEEEKKTVTNYLPPEELPDLCNEFYAGFMELNDFFGINDINDKNEIVSIIQHFCYWLFLKEYTKSKLLLAF